MSVIFQDQSTVLNLYGRGTEILCFIYSIRGGKWLGSLPSKFSNRRLCVWNSQIVNRFFVFHPNVGAGSCIDRAIVIVFFNDLILSVQIFNVIFFYIEYKSPASIPIHLAYFLYTIPTDEQIHDKAENGKADNEYELVFYIFQHGHAKTGN